MSDHKTAAERHAERLELLKQLEAVLAQLYGTQLMAASKNVARFMADIFYAHRRLIEVLRREDEAAEEKELEKLAKRLDGVDQPQHEPSEVELIKSELLRQKYDEMQRQAYREQQARAPYQWGTTTGTGSSPFDGGPFLK